MTTLAFAVFLCVYLGMALGRWPGLRLDRTGIALLGAIVLYATGAIDTARAARAIDVATLFVLFGLMILSAQFAACGFYDACAHRIASSDLSPGLILALVVAVSGLLSAVLANDVVCFAMTPLLCAGLKRRGLDPRPFLIGLAAASNAGSAATLIGNPQNILIGQTGGLHFVGFLALCGPPALAALVLVWAVIRVTWREALRATPDAAPAGGTAPPLRRAGAVKGALATLVLLALFTTGGSHVTGALLVAGGLMISRHLASRAMLALVDWHLLVLFAALFVVTAGLSDTGLPARMLADLQAAGLGLERLGTLAGLSLVGSNTIGNVPAVILILAAAPGLGEATLTGLALLSTLAGNLLLVGSLANIIVAERAAAQGVTLGLADHARAGIPITLLSMAVAVAWLWAIGTMAF
ncbi:SLC13 family permease [Marinivivus vitaminiproducens]|uniref:SLC13 family permease n=1 Tax=Marinivivus vitaminiproducens TaxID=3035935 RepID=UPI00279EA8F4|nr:SLC13 family permease [Geminicoccaceae bacterium SCSIO 64248]